MLFFLDTSTFFSVNYPIFEEEKKCQNYFPHTKPLTRLGTIFIYHLHISKIFITKILYFFFWSDFSTNSKLFVSMSNVPPSLRPKKGKGVKRKT